MNRIPVGPTIAEAYRFTFMGLERIIGVAWLPILLMTIGDYFVSGRYYSGLADALEANDPMQAMPLVAGMLGYAAVKLLLVSMIGVGVTREILAPLQRPLFLRVSFGSAELRFAAAVFALYMLMFFFLMVCLIVGSVISGPLGAIPGMAAGAKALGIGALFALLCAPVLIYVLVRLSFLVAPAIVMEKGFGIERSWKLTSGNVLRIIVIAIAVLVPVVLVSGMLQSLVVGPGGAGNLNLFAATPQQSRETAEALRQMASHLPLLMGVQFVVAPFLCGLFFAAPAFAYKALTGSRQE